MATDARKMAFPPERTRLQKYCIAYKVPKKTEQESIFRCECISIIVPYRSNTMEAANIRKAKSMFRKHKDEDVEIFEVTLLKQNCERIINSKRRRQRINQKTRKARNS